MAKFSISMKEEDREPVSYQAEFSTGGAFATNACRYATFLEANNAGSELQGRWMAVTEYRVVGSTDPVNYRFDLAQWRSERITNG